MKKDLGRKERKKKKESKKGEMLVEIKRGVGGRGCFE